MRKAVRNSLSFQEQVELWKNIQSDIQSEWYSNKFSIINFIQSKGHKIIENMRLNYCPNVTILEIGCSIGIHASFIREKTTFYIGLDISRKHLSLASKEDNTTFICGDIYHLPFKSNSCQVILSLYNLEHLFELLSAIKEIKRVLAISGKFLVAIPNEGGVLWDLGRNLTIRRYIEKRYPINYLEIIRRYEHPNNAFYIRELLKRHFRIIEERQYPFNICPIHLNLLTIFALEKTN